VVAVQSRLHSREMFLTNVDDRWRENAIHRRLVSRLVLFHSTPDVHHYYTAKGRIILRIHGICIGLAMLAVMAAGCGVESTDAADHELAELNQAATVGTSSMAPTVTTAFPPVWSIAASTRASTTSNSMATSDVATASAIQRRSTRGSAASMVRP
jgi:hypothetical protein